jgi:ionotropic glutamate receptor NMDA 3A
MLLERLGRDLGFQIQLYVTADEQFGHMNLVRGGWTGLVGDLLNGSAHMAISAFSITQSRSRVIDFTAPYFYAGFVLYTL